MFQYYNHKSLRKCYKRVCVYMCMYVYIYVNMYVCVYICIYIYTHTHKCVCVYSLKKGMATHSGILPWRIPLTEKPGRLQYVRLQRVGHSWARKSVRYDLEVEHSGKYICVCVAEYYDRVTKKKLSRIKLYYIRIRFCEGVNWKFKELQEKIKPCKIFNF